MALLRKIQCKILGHQYAVRQVFTPESRRVGCNRCGGDWAMNDRERIIVPWSAEFDRFYAEFSETLRAATQIAEGQ